MAWGREYGQKSVLPASLRLLRGIEGKRRWHTDREI